ncbi:glycosyl hydrolase family 18 protein [Flavivirga jejuensis]|uniref:chitinase n=1 Tax=Flavivirga jejuensis TaxID=870487 RepID=A0ABT8WPT0_9FLAO|nr:glycosyl hydrolase family 18 protein [Flavivirga jejuensis]MDO5974906.1 glycosyl hydrolase family 18 protein [Flavivirga jejuensis]
MRTCDFIKTKVFFVGLLLGSIYCHSQEPPEPPKPPEVTIEKPKIVDQIINIVGTGLGLSKKSKQKKEGLQINKHTLHESELAYYKKNTNTFQSLHDITYRTTIDSLKYTVLGWSPFWVKDAYKYYTYKLLSDISYFNYELDTETGDFKTIHDWNTTPMIDIAKSNKCTVSLTLSSYGKQDNAAFLNNHEAQEKSIHTLINLLKYRKAHGVTIDMHPITPATSSLFTQYINTLATALHQEQLVLNLVLPPVYINNTFDIPNLSPNVDLFIILGYGYASDHNKKAGPLSPLLADESWRFHALETSIDSYLEQGVPPNKCIVSLPYLGTQWQVKKPEIPSLKSKHIKYFPLRSKQSFLDNHKFQLDPLSYTMFTSFPTEKKAFYQVWIDTRETLKEKFQLIKNKELKGVALWSLGYDNGSTEFWELLEESFAYPQPNPIEPQKQEDLEKSISIIDSLLVVQRNLQDSTNLKIDKISEKITDLNAFNEASQKDDSPIQLGENLKKEVFGWHPHWADEKYKSYNFKLLTTLAYFSYELNPSTGQYKTIHNWATTKVVDSAHAKGTKVHLTVTNFGVNNNRTFLNNPEAQKDFINEVVKQVEKRSADGVNINFENIPKASSEKFTQFTILLSERLQREGLEFSMAIPALDPNHVYDFKTLINFVDYFVMMGYNYHYKNSKTAGPNAPLKSSTKWGKLSIEHSVNTYFSRGIPPIQLIVAYPYYGIESKTASIKIPAKNEGFIKEWTYGNIRKEFRKAPILDMESTSAYYIIPSPSDNQIKQLWFDNEESFALKCDWINQKKLRGVGIWALGYDHGNNELWTVLNQKFAKDPNEVILTPLHSGETLLFKVKHILNDLNLNSNTIIALLIIMLVILFIGFSFAITNGQVVDIIFSNKLYQASLIILLLVTIISILKLKNLISSSEVLFLLGGFIGIMTTFIIRKRIVESEKNKP